MPSLYLSVICRIRKFGILMMVEKVENNKAGKIKAMLKTHKTQHNKG